MVYLHMHFLQLTCHWIHEPTGASSGDDSGTADLLELPARSRQHAAGVKFNQTIQELLKQGKNAIDDFIPTNEGKNAVHYPHPKRLPDMLSDYKYLPDDVSS